MPDYENERKRLLETTDLVELRSALAEAYGCCGRMERELSATSDRAARAADSLNLYRLYGRQLLDLAPIKIFAVDADFRFVIASTALIRMLTPNRAEKIEEMPFGALFARVAEDEWIARMTARFGDVMTSGVASDFQDTLTMKDGKHLQLQTTLSPAIDDAGRRLGVVVVMRDVTELSDALDRAQAADKAKMSFLANLSHEIRTPMNAIKGMTDLLLLTQLDGIQRGYAQSVTNASHSLLGIINDLLDFSKIEADELVLQETQADIASLITDITGITHLKASEKGLDFISHINPLTPSAIICDDLRLKQVLLNILNNAVKFTAAGSVRFTLKCETARGDRVRLTFAVSDTGVGIRAEDIPAIGKPFAQTETYNERTVEGTGLGLAISAKIIEKMGGHLEVESVFGAGSVFSFSIETRAATSLSLAQALSPLSKRALIVANDAHAQEYHLMLNDLGVNFDIADSEDALLKHLESSAYTHLIYRYDFGHPLVERHAAHIPESCHIVAVKNIKAASRQYTAADVEVLFEPLLVTGMAQALNTRKSFQSTANAKSRALDTIGSFRFTDVNVLIVDDNEINLLVESELLRQYEIEPDTAESAREAFGRIAEKKYDILFMDHMMPEINGIEATRMIREMDAEWLREVPIIALTANALTGMKETYLSCGMNDFISKPIEIAELNRVLLRWLPEGKISAVPKPQIVVRTTAGGDILKQLGQALNVESALKNIGGSEGAYLNVAKAFLHSVPEKLESIRAFLAEGNHARFRIDIHATKSSLLNIGALELSEEARALELAAISGEFEYIEESFGHFDAKLQELLQFMDGLLPADSRPDNANKAAGSIEKLGTRLMRVSSLLDDLEYYQALDEMEDIASERYGKEMDRALLRIRAAIESFNYDQATELIRRILEADSRREDAHV